MSGPDSTPQWIVQLAEGIREEWPWWVAGQLLIGLALVGLGVAGILPAKGLSGFVGSFLLVYASLILLQRPEAALLGAGLKRRLHVAIASSGVGFYGVLCLSRFVQLEVHDLIESLAELEFTRSMAGSLLIEWVIGFSMESLMNSIQSMIWPVQMFTSHGLVKAAVVIGPLWAMYRFGAWLYPELRRQIEAEDDALWDEIDADAADSATPADPPAPEVPPPPPR